MLLKSGQESGFEIPYLEGGIKSPTGLLHHQNGKAPVQRSGMISPAVENCWTSKQGTIHSPASSGCQTPVYSRGQSAVATELATVEEGYISLVPPQGIASLAGSWNIGMEHNFCDSQGDTLHTHAHIF